MRRERRRVHFLCERHFFVLCLLLLRSVYPLNFSRDRKKKRKDVFAVEISFNKPFGFRVQDFVVGLYKGSLPRSLLACPVQGRGGGAPSPGNNPGKKATGGGRLEWLLTLTLAQLAVTHFCIKLIGKM